MFLSVLITLWYEIALKNNLFRYHFQTSKQAIQSQSAAGHVSEGTESMIKFITDFEKFLLRLTLGLMIMMSLQVVSIYIYISQPRQFFEAPDDSDIGIVLHALPHLIRLSFDRRAVCCHDDYCILLAEWSWKCNCGSTDSAL